MNQVILLFLYLVTFSFNPWQVTVFLPIKNAILVFSLFFFAVISILRKKLYLPTSPLFYWIVAFWIWGVFHIRFFSERDSYFFLFPPIIIPILLSQLRPIDLKKVFMWIVILGVAMSIYGIFQFLGIDFSFWKNNEGRNAVFGLFGNTNYFSFYLVPALIISMVYYINSVGILKFIYLLGLLIIALGISVTFTRSTIFALLIASFILNYRKKKVLILSIAIFLVILSIFYLLNIEGFRERIYDTIFIKGGTERRLFIWKVSLFMIRFPNILWGNGIGWYGYLFPYYQALYVNYFNLPFPHAITYYAHNEYLQILIELGLLGISLFLGIICYFLKTLKEAHSPYKLISLGVVISYLIISIFGFPLHLPHTSFFFWFFLSVPIVFSQGREVSLIPFFKVFFVILIIFFLFIYMNFYFSHSYAYFDIYKKVAFLNPYWGEMRKKYSISLLKNGFIEKGEIELKNSAKSYIGPFVFYNLGLLDIMKGEYEKAKEDFKKALILARNEKERIQILKYIKKYFGDFE